MASASDGRKNRAKVRYSGMEQPPLIRMLKNILSEYPDGGQILKELIQNAEDAGAREVKLLFDERRINDRTDESSPEYAKFFKAPALCVYNDAVFSDRDWKGIQMIYSSVKEKEKLKVGKFGLGFKSVFHITDYPCVLSGEKFLAINPHRPAHMVNGMFDLCDINDYEDEGLIAADFWKVLNNTFGLKRSVLESQAGNFPGTLFWFPLRETRSDLSETLYNEAKVNDLFESFQSEAGNLMIFMKSLERISLHRRLDHEDMITDDMVVEIENAKENVRQKRDEFNDKVTFMPVNVNADDIHCFIPMTIHLQSSNRDVKVDWYVVNYLVNNCASEKFKELITDENTGKCPYVGVAVPINEQIHGHVYCFLPLPQEGETLTGLPVHINGFFELNQNRHNLKWDTDEHAGKPTDDRYILWNMALIDEALPKAYECLVMGAIEHMPVRPKMDDLRSLYNMFPLCKTSSNAQRRWSNLSKRLYHNLENQRIVYSQTSEEWIHVKDACFATFRDVNAHDTTDSIVRCLKSLNKMYVNVPSDLFDTFCKHFSYLEDLNAKKLSSHLKYGGGYRDLAHHDKLNILKYLLTAEANEASLTGLELLPLENNTWCQFNKFGQRIFLCSDDEEVDIFPGLGHKLVLRQSQLGMSLHNKLNSICMGGMSQIRKLTTDTIKNFLTELLAQYYGSNCLPTLSNYSSLSIDWLETVWKVLQRKGNIQLFDNVPLIPVLKDGTWTSSSVVELHKPDELFMMLDTNKCVLTSELRQCFEAFMVTFVPSLPCWISPGSVQKCLYKATNDGMLSLLKAISCQKSLEMGISKFNNLSEHLTQSLKLFLIQNQSVDMKIVNFVKRLRIFNAVESSQVPGYRTSVSESPSYMLVKDLDMLPKIQLPQRVIRANANEEELLRRLGAYSVTLSSLVRNILQSFKSKVFRNPSDSNARVMIAFMEFVVYNFDMFGQNRDIMNMAKNIPFLISGSTLHKPCQLFNPFDKELKELLLGQNLFPEQGLTENQVYVLSLLGLKSTKDLDENIIYQVGTECHRMSGLPTEKDSLRRKSSHLMRFLCENPHFMSRTCMYGKSLLQCLNDLNWVPVAGRPPEYPSNIPWFSDGKIVCKPSGAVSASWAFMVGAQTDVVVCDSDEVSTLFKWKNAPRLETMVMQLEVLQKNFELQYKPEFLHVIQRIYNFFSQQNTHQIQNLKSFVANRRIVWTGMGFEVPEKVIVASHPGDIDLKPFYYTTPSEFTHLEQMFLLLGCQPLQDIKLLSQTLHDVKSCSDAHAHAPETRELVLRVLRKISASVKSNSDVIKELNLLMLVENDTDCIELQPISHCILDENDDNSEEDSDLRFVHEKVPHQVAIDLGIKSAKSKTLTDAINSFQPWGQTEPLTKRIETLLKREYTFGLGVPKELIQNADDAGANVVKFMFDERVNDDAKEKLLSSEMSDCQGSALWVYNNETFSETDLENIRLLNGGTKAEDDEKIGRFGLGFCAVYNLTELPCFISGENLVIFDPQEKYIHNLCDKNSFGLKINLTNRRKRRLIRDHIDQFKPFQNMFGCTPMDSNFNGFNGTIFRFPLRTSDQAISSKLCQKPCLREDILKLLEAVIENAGNLLLFTQHVTSIQIFHIPKEESIPNNASLIFEINKSTEDMSGNVGTNVQSVLSRLHYLTKPNLSEVHSLTIEQKLLGSPKFSMSISPYNNQTSWLLSWVSLDLNTWVSVQEEKSKKHIPVSAVALPVTKGASGNIIPRQLQDVKHGFYSNGFLFCFLPLPIRTEMPFYINGCFEVSSDRKQLVHCTIDEIGRTGGQNWNQQVLKISVVASFIQLLEYLACHCDPTYKYYRIWPIKACTSLNVFRKSFFSNIYTTQKKLFQSLVGWHSFDEIVFLHPKIKQQSFIYDTAFNMLCSFPMKTGKQVVDMPEDVFQALSECVDSSTSKFADAIIFENELLLHFLNIIDDPYWDDKIDSRNKLILLALEKDDESILNKLKESTCIPRLPDGILKRPCELINPNREIAQMFDVSDGYFPEEGDFRAKDILAKLTHLGMMNEILSEALLIDRCHSVSSIRNTCSSCSREQCARVLKYISRQVIKNSTEKDEALLEHLRKIPIVPILNRPEDWSFSWTADRISGSDSKVCEKHLGTKCTPFNVEKPTELHRENIGNCLGSVTLVVDERFLQSACSIYFPSRMYGLLGIKDSAPPELYKKQLLHFSDEYKDVSQVECLMTHHRQIFSKLHQFLDNSEDTTSAEEIVRDLFCDIQNENIVLIRQKLIAPVCVAFNLKAQYFPYLCQLPTAAEGMKKLFSLIGVCEYFSPRKIVDVLKIVKHSWKENQCISTVEDLLKNLCESMDKEGATYNDLQDVKEFIVAPDESGTLFPTYCLVINDRLFFSKKQMHFLHGQIQPDLARLLGVKSKRKHVVDGFSKLIRFGQKENLSTRLRGLLEDYPCDASIMKELLQNADDAKATELHFIKDFRKKSSSDNQSFGSKALQPPALCVFNDGYFTDADFEGIQNLGEGSKKRDPTKTGQYGVGFNTVYHMTDSPSFFTKGPNLGPSGTLCIFDPLLKVIPEYVSEEERGIKCDVEEMVTSFPDILNYYLTDQPFFAKGEGTLFRLPLRTEKTDISDEIMTEKKVNDFLEEMKEDLLEMLLFVKNVQKIIISRIDESNEVIEEYCVETKLSSSGRKTRNDFFHLVQTDGLSGFLPQMTVDYQMNILDSCGKEADWFVVQCYGFGNSDVDATLKAVRDDGICQLPLGAVAMPVIDKQLHKCITDTKLGGEDTDKQIQGLKEVFKKEVDALKKFTGRLYCFLPLKCTTKLKFHYNGHFVLDRARKSVNMIGTKGEWNDLLLNEIIAKAWIHGMMHIAKDTECLVKNAPNWGVVNLAMEIYHMFFPLYTKDDDNINAVLAGCIYKNLTRQRILLMPVIMSNKDVARREKILGDMNTTNIPSKEKFCLTWTALATTDIPFDGVFNNIIKIVNLPTSYIMKGIYKRQIAHQIGNTLKMVGMKLIEIPLSVFDAVVSYGIEAFCADPEIVARFMSSYNIDGDGSCSVGKIDIPVEDTLLATKSNVTELISYIIQKKKASKDELDSVHLLKGLPLCLTCDGKLRLFNPDSPVFVSEHAHLLPNSLSCFLSPNLRGVLDSRLDDLKSAGLTKPFGITDLHQLLDHSYNSDLLASSSNVRWMKDENNPISSKFLKGLYLFLVEESQHLFIGSTETRVFVSEKFKENMIKLKEWAFIPSVFMVCDKKVFELIPISSGEKVLYVDNSDSMTYDDVLMKLNVPLFDTTIFTEKTSIFGNRFEISQMYSGLKNVVATMSNPCSFIRFLNHYKDRIASSDISAADGELLLSFFDRHVRDLVKGKSLNMIRDLPLFKTVEGELKDLTAFASAMVLPDEVPKDGLLEWSKETNILLLCNSPHVVDIYEELKLTSINSIQFYTKWLLPRTSYLHQDYFMKHVVFIRDAVLPRLPIHSNEYKQVIDTLKILPFIQVQGQSMTVRELFLDDDPVFCAMIDKKYFLPAEYSDEKWLSFLKPLGLNVEVSQQQLIQYATEIAANGAYHVLEKTKSQSRVLLEFFVDNLNKWDTTTLDKIKNVKFILPNSVGKCLDSIHPQIDDGKHLVCFNGSAPFFLRYVCWTSLHLIAFPKYLGHIKLDVCERLGIQCDPQISSVISHCQNICEKLHDRINNYEVQKIKQIFENNYLFLSGKIDSIGKDEICRLRYTHFIFIIDELQLMKTSEVVVELREEDEIKPYLWRLPENWSRFRDVFLQLGSERDVNCSHYIAVLKRIKHDFPDQVPPKNMEDVAKCIKGIVKLLESNGDIRLPNTGVVMYLPNREMKLVDSRNLTISDNESFEKRLGHICNIDFFIGFQQLDINVSDPRKLFEKLPVRLKPSILTDLVKEFVRTDSITEIRDNFASRLQSFLRCHEMKQGVIRLVKHQQNVENLDLTNATENDMVSKLENICVQRVTGLQTSIEYEGNIVPHSDKSKTCFIEQSDVNQYKLIFQKEEKTPDISDILEEEDGLLDLIDKCTHDILKKYTYKHLSPILRNMHDPSQIKILLDEKKIAAYNLPNSCGTSVFPPPGTYVPEHFFPFLEGGLLPFREHEFRYVAFDVGEFNESLDEYNEVYIYAHIIRQVSHSGAQGINIQYEIDIGDEANVTVPIYRLFKFVPQQIETGTDLVVYDDEPVGTVAFDENCRRIKEMLTEAWSKKETEKRRIIRRLKLKWHPDKNLTEKDYAHRVYNYLNYVISQLERWGRVDNNVPDSPTDMRNSAYSSMDANIYRTGCRYAQAWRDNYDRYRHGEDFSHMRATSAVVPDVANGKRWQRQATNDYRMAESSLTVAGPVHGYNWICYKCHQACEKSLKAAGFAKDANRVARNSHSLSELAHSLSDENLTRLVQGLETSLGSYFGLRYPDACGRQHIPSDVITKGQAESALQVTKQVLDIVSDMID